MDKPNQSDQSEKHAQPRRTTPMPQPKKAGHARQTEQERQPQRSQGGAGPMAEPTSGADDFETEEAIDREEGEDLQRYARNYRQPTETLERDRGLSQ